MTNKEGMEFSTRKPAPKAKLKSTKSVPAVPLGSMSRFSLRSSSGKKKERSASSGGSSSSVQRPLCTLSVRNQSCAMNTATTPSLKPTPYLEPINTRTTGKQVGGTRAPLIPPPKIVADRKARSDETNSKVVARTQSERTSTVLSKQRTRRRELAYLIVDLRTGRPTYSTKSVGELDIVVVRSDSGLPKYHDKSGVMALDGIIAFTNRSLWLQLAL